MSTKLTYTGAEVQELLDKIEKGDFDNAKTLEGHPASYFAIASEFTSLAESFAAEQGRVNTLYSYFNNGSANDALRLGGQLPSYYATATQYEILQQTLADFKSLFDSMFEKDSDGNIHAKLSLWSSGGITAGGVGSGSSGGGGISYNRLDSWADYSADKSGWVLSALLGKDLDSRVSALANAGYVTASALAPYALRSEIPSLVGYATESFVTSQGYITASALGGYATQSWVGDNYLPLSGGTLTDALTVKGSGSPLTVHRTQSLASVVKFVNTDGVLGWLGVDVDKTAIFMTASGVIKKLLHSGNYADYVTNSYVKSTLGISDWALAATKPTYTASEVGALSVNDTATNANKLGGYLPTTYMRASGQYTDSLNDLTSLGIYRMSGTIKDGPTGAGGYGNLMVVRSNSWDTLSQLYFNANNNRIFVRSGTNSNFTSKDWSTLAYISDIPSLAGYATQSWVNTALAGYLPLNGGTLTGNVTAPTFTGVINSVAPKALLLSMSYTAGQYSRSVSEEDGKIFIGSSANNNVISSPKYDGTNTVQNIQSLKLAYNSAFFTEIATTPNSDHLWKRNVSSSTANPWERFVTEKAGVTWNISITGNAGSATKLATPRSIWGQSFDGTGDITGDIMFAGPNKIAWHNDKNYYYISSPTTSTSAYLEYNAYGGHSFLGGNVTIGGGPAYERLYVYGNGKFTGALTVNSLTIGGVTLTYDSGNEALCINGNMYALGGVTAGGAGISAYTSLEARVARIEQQLNIS